MTNQRFTNKNILAFLQISVKFGLLYQLLCYCSYIAAGSLGANDIPPQPPTPVMNITDQTTHDTRLSPISALYRQGGGNQYRWPRPPAVIGWLAARRSLIGRHSASLSAAAP